MPGFAVLQCGYILLKEVFKLLLCEHGIYHLKDHRLVIRVKFLDQLYLLNGRFIFYGYPSCP